MNSNDREERVQSEIRARLKKVCAHMSGESFEQMVRDIAVNEMKPPYYGAMRDREHAPVVIDRVTGVRS